MERNSQNVLARASVVQSEIKREASDDGGDEPRKRTRNRLESSCPDTSREDPFVGAINAAIEGYRYRDESEKRGLQNKIALLEAQLKKSTEVKVGPKHSAGELEDSSARPSDGGPSVLSPQSVAEIKELIDTVIKLTADKESLLSRIDQKNQRLRFESDLLNNKDDEIDRLKSNLSALNRGIKKKNLELVLCAQEYSTGDGPVIDDHSGRLGKMLHDAEDEKKMIKEELEKREETNAQLLKSQNKKIRELEHEVAKTKKINDRNFIDRVVDQGTYRKALKEVHKELKECSKRVKTQELSKTQWEKRTNDMYDAYQDVFEKNQKLVAKLEAVWKAGSFDSGLSAKNRKTLEGLKSRSLDELTAVQED